MIMMVIDGDDDGGGGGDDDHDDRDIPRIAIQIAGSRVGTSNKSGNISSMIRNLSKNSMIFPRHTRQFTRT